MVTELNVSVVNLTNGNVIQRTLLHTIALGLLVSTSSVMAQTPVSELDKQANKLTLYRTEMDFAGYFKRLKNGRFKQQSKLVENLSAQLVSVSDSSITWCDKVALDNIKYTLHLANSRLGLLERLTASSPEYQGSFSKLHEGDKWYAHWLQSWLHADVTVAELEAIALSELADASARRAQLSNSELLDNLIELNGDDSAAIVSAYRQREHTVYQYSEPVFGVAFAATAVNITKSNLPKSFPAPGIYDPTTQAFIYHLHADTLPVKQMDWLFLHEAVPGHHFFSEYAQHAVACPSYKIRQGTTLFTEGWAAYVETLGHQLGLFTDRTSAEYALDWQELRAVRVLIDIGIHAEGWDDKQAQDVWMSHIPEQKDIMLREINRIRRWPVQVITYVYGKAKIMQAIAEIMSRSPETPLADIHRDILNLSNFSLRALDHITALQGPA